MITSQRVEVNPSEVNSAVKQDVRGVTVKVMLSPFDVPRIASADYDKNEHILRLKFDYIGSDEPTTEKPVGDGISLVVGRHSERLYGINILIADLLVASIDAAKAEFVIDATEEHLTRYQLSNPNMKSRSFEAVNRVLKRYSSEFKPVLQEALVSAS